MREREGDTGTRRDISQIKATYQEGEGSEEGKRDYAVNFINFRAEKDCEVTR